jgi:hypothetical protein
VVIAKAAVLLGRVDPVPPGFFQHRDRELSLVLRPDAAERSTPPDREQKALCRIT